MNAIEEHLCPQYIKFTMIQREINEQKKTFMNRFHLPWIVRVIDVLMNKHFKKINKR